MQLIKQKVLFYESKIVQKSSKIQFLDKKMEIQVESGVQKYVIFVKKTQYFLAHFEKVVIFKKVVFETFYFNN